MDLVKHVAPTHPPPDPHTSLKPGQAPSSSFHYIRIRRSPTFPRAKFLLTHHRFVHRQRQPNRKPSLDEGSRGAVSPNKINQQPFERSRTRAQSPSPGPPPARKEFNGNQRILLPIPYTTTYRNPFHLLLLLPPPSGPPRGLEIKHGNNDLRQQAILPRDFRR